MRAWYSIKKKIFSYYTTAKSPSTTFLYLWGSFTTTSTFLSLSSSNTAFLLFSIQHHLHHISLFPPNTHTHVHTHYQHISIVFHPPPPLHFVCFPCTTTSTTILLLSVHYLHHHLISIVFHPQPPTHFCGFSSATFTTFLFFPCTTTSATFLLFSIYHHDHLSVIFYPPPSPHFYCFSCTTSTTFLFFSSSPSINTRFQKLPPPPPPPSNFYVFFISMLTRQNEQKNRFGQRKAREWK